ncbi:ArnT family glycosyltransferase [Vampirovibrio sp.]|uniref:ArnT family glycosyltransferase n=1 Tax=Vampirovibrio sp. TaxID=2717857 RepID=UPI003593C8B5
MTTSVKATQPQPTPQKRQSILLDSLLLIAVCFILFFLKLGSYPLFDLDEPRYAEAAREMLESGNWVTPYFNYEVRFEKPVLFYWLIALAYKWFGLSEFSARFFSAVGASAIVGMVYAFGGHFISRQYGLYSALILATSILFIGIARMSITDMTLACFMTGTTLCLFLAAHKNLKWWLAAGAVAGLGILTKGPVALILPGAIFTLYTLVTAQFKRCLLNRWLPLALLIALLIAGPWYVAIYLENGPIFIESQFMNNVTRFSDVVSGHQQPPYFYPLVLIVGFLPWTLYLPAAIAQLWHDFRTNHRPWIAHSHFPYLISLYSALWIAFIFIFFSLGSTKLLTYILPLFPALALLTATAWHRFISEDKGSTLKASGWFRIPSLILPIGILVGGTVFITNMDKLLPREAAGIEANSYNLMAVAVLMLGALCTTWLIHQKRAEQALKAQALTMMVLVAVAMQGIVPNVSKAAQSVMMGFLKKTNGQPLMLYEIQRTSLTFYGQRRVPRYVEEQQTAILAELDKSPQTFVITKNQHVDNFRPLIPRTYQLNIVEKDAVYSLLSVRKKP